MNSTVASCTEGPGGGARHAATSAKRAMRPIGATINPRWSVGLIVLLNEPMWMTRPARSSDASAGAAQPGAISGRDDDLRRRTVDAAGDGKIARNLSPELELAAPIWIDGCRARFNPDSLCADAREERCRKGLRRRDAHLEEGGPLGHLLIDFQERPGIWLLLALHHRARTRGDSGASRARGDGQLGRGQLFIGCPS